MENSDEQPTRKVGRPPGKKNGGKPLTPLSKLPHWDNYSTPPKLDYRHEDIQTLVGRQLSMVGLAQDRIRQEMIGSDGSIAKTILLEDVERLNQLSMSLVRALDGLQRATKIAEELKDKLTPEQLLEGAIQKIMAQDLPTLTDIMKRLEKHRKKDPRHNAAARVRTVAAADALADLED